MTERKTLYKWLWAWDFEKEERWLNEMAPAYKDIAKEISKGIKEGLKEDENEEK